MPSADCRDYDARIALEISNGDVEAARNDNLAPGQTFRDPGTYGPFHVPVTTPLSEGDYLQSLTKITYVPTKRERWITDVVISAKFSHGITYVSHSGVVVFEHTANALEFKNDSAVRMLSPGNRSEAPN